MKSNFIKKSAIATALLFAALCAGTSAAEWTEYETSLLQEIFSMRAESRKCASFEESQKFLENYHNKILSDEIQSKIGDEARLAFDNLLILERWQYHWETDPKMDGLKEMIFPQFEKNLSWNESHPFAEQNPWLKLSSFDLINSTMQYLKQGQLIKLGLQEKKVYDSLLEEFPDMSLNFLLAGHWYYNAPAIGGGSKTKARHYYETAARNASNPYEKYFSNIYLAQNELGHDYTKYEEYMTAAEEAIPGTPYLQFVLEINGAGRTLYEYALDPQNTKEQIFK